MQNFSRSSHVCVTTLSPILKFFFFKTPHFRIATCRHPAAAKKSGVIEYLGKIGNHSYAIFLFGSWGRG